VAEWDKVAAEEERPTRLLLRYALPLALVPAAARAVGLALFGGRDAAGAFRLSPTALILDALLGYGLTLLALATLVVIATLLAAPARAAGGRHAPLRLAVYASTAGWIGGLANLAPPARPLGALLALWGVVVFAAGAARLVRPRKGALIAYVAATLLLFAAAEALTAIVVRLVLSLS
jgi:hypothetical protein